MHLKTFLFQGMNFIAGYLILITKNEEESFWLLDALIGRILPGMLKILFYSYIGAWLLSLHSSPAVDNICIWSVQQLSEFPCLDLWICRRCLHNQFCPMYKLNLTAHVRQFKTRSRPGTAVFFTPVKCIWECFFLGFNYRGRMVLLYIPMSTAQSDYRYTFNVGGRSHWKTSRKWRTDSLLAQFCFCTDFYLKWLEVEFSMTLSTRYWSRLIETFTFSSVCLCFKIKQQKKLVPY